MTDSTSRFGGTWRSKFGATWVFVAMLMTSSLLASTLSPTPESDEVGTLGVSMIDMLSTSSGSGTTSLSMLKHEVMNGKIDASGKGIDVALIDTGVAPVAGLENVMHGPDLSFEGASPQAAYIDTYGHGTHMAGIIAGTRSGQQGVAPGARIISVKVAGHDGKTTVPQVVAAIDWVVEHRNQDGLNIRVLNLSLGQQNIKTHIGDPLSMAVEKAWKAGIFVVVAAGNDGETYGQLDSPAIDPYVLAVGAADSLSADERNDLLVPSWSAMGNGSRDVDIVAGGRSVASYRVPGSSVDAKAPNARVGDDLFKGSGTSQAAAALSGAAALMLEANPSMSNDDLKKTFMAGADDLGNNDKRKAGEGLVDVVGASSDLQTNRQKHLPADNTSGLKVLSGKIQPVIGTTLSSTDTTFTATSLTTTRVYEPVSIEATSGATWSGGTWSGGTWSGATWSGATWSGGTWSGATWSGMKWSGATWSGATWSGGTWSGATWSGATWSGATWSGATWSGKGWN